MIYLITFISFLLIFSLLYAILILLNIDKIKIQTRLKELNTFHTTDEEINDVSFFERIIKPFYQSISNVLLKITPSHKLVVFNKRLEKAGLLKNSTLGKWLFVKNVMTLIFSLIIALLSYMVEPNIIKATVLGLLTTVFVGVFFNFYLSRKIEIRKNKIIKDLPYTLDLITVSVEAGLSFDGAMARVINNISGELCDEFAKSLKEEKMGIERKVALKNMSERCDVKELSMLIASLIQADELGVSLSRILRIESANSREHRKQIAREKAMKAPIKMLIPLVLFIFPSVFIIILGPAVIRIIDMFVKI